MGMENQKGEYKGLCNRSACLKPGALYFNHSTRKYYCSQCAILINEANPESFKMYGRALCVKDDIGINKNETY